MNIYVSHSSNFDYINKLYNPIKNSQLINNNEFFLPHDNDKVINTKDYISNCDLLIAEVSLPATGQGIELGWADYAKTPILCIYEKGSKISSSLKFITNNFIEYENEKDMINKIDDFINSTNESFYSKSNMQAIDEAIKELEEGKFIVKNLEELKSMEND